jgi:type II secretory pathway pseudopilin PulG
MTLVEVCVAFTVLMLLMGGLLTALIQSRRLTEGSIAQNSALIVVQGYLEQIKNMDFSALPYYESNGSTLHAGADTASGHQAYIPTLSDENTADPLVISPGSPVSLASVTPGATTPSGVVDNAKSVVISQTPGTPSAPLNLRLWVWIQDVSDSSVDATQVRAITIIYQYSLTDGRNSMWFANSVRTIRSSVPTY